MSVTLVTLGRRSKLQIDAVVTAGVPRPTVRAPIRSGRGARAPLLADAARGVARRAPGGSTVSEGCDHARRGEPPGRHCQAYHQCDHQNHGPARHHLVCFLLFLPGHGVSAIWCRGCTRSPLYTERVLGRPAAAQCVTSRTFGSVSAVTTVLAPDRPVPGSAVTQATVSQVTLLGGASETHFGGAL